MDTLDLSPGKSIGLFALGDTLWHVVDILRARKSEVPKLDIAWDPENSAKSAVIVHAGPVALLFSPETQRLSHIRVLLPTSATITYEGAVLSSPSVPLTRAGVARALGPTYANDGALAYPGVIFNVPPGRDESVASLSVIPKDDDESLADLQSCVLLPGRGAGLLLSNGTVDINLGLTTAQDLLVDLGPPLRKYWKEDDRLGRVWGGQVSRANGMDPDFRDEHREEEVSTPCFWNYFQYGMDFLIEDDVVTKIIVHTNIPGTPQFQQYARCPWVVQCDPGELDFTHPLSAFRERLQGTSAPSSVPSRSSNGTPEAGGGGGGGKKKKNNNKRNGSSDAAPAPPTKDVPADAMILDRSVEGGLEGVVGMGVSQLVGFDGLIVEVDEKSGGVTSVQVWGPQ